MSDPARPSRQHVVATAGHVDHGKSTLLRALTGMEPDRWEAERERGLTIDLGFVWTDLVVPGAPTVTVAFVDVPGHERFVANMLAGAGAVRLALFVVAADDGWSAQSQEHLDILDLLGVAAAVVAVTKAGAAGDDRALEVAADVESRLWVTSLAGAPVVVVDAVDGTGLDELRHVLATRLSAVAPLADTGRSRLWIDRVFTIAGAGTVATGTLAGGGVATGATVAVLPEGVAARVRGLHSLGRAVATAPPGTRVAVNLAGADRDRLARGSALVAGGDQPGQRWVVTSHLDAWVRTLPDHEVAPAGAWHLHVGSAEVVTDVRPLLGEPVTAETPGFVRLRLAAPLPLQAGDRFVLREAGRRATVGGGVVVDPVPPATVRGADQRLERVEALEPVLAALAAGDGDGALVGGVRAAGGAREESVALAAAGLSRGDGVPGLVRVDRWLVTAEAVAAWTSAVTAAAASHHAARPESPGRSRQDLARIAAVTGCPDADLAAALPDHLAATGVLTRHGAAYALPEHTPAVDTARAARRAALVASLGREPLAPPDLDAAARAAGVTYGELQSLLQSGEIVRCGAVGFTRFTVDQAVVTLHALQADVGPFTASQARAAWGTTRKYAIPLLEHLDATGVTVFDGTTRRLR